MRILIAHRFAPGHFRNLLPFLVAEGHDCVVLSEAPSSDTEGTMTLRVTPHREPRPETHPYVQSFERSVLLGQAAFRAAQDLAQSGYRPDVILTHGGFGIALYLRELWPEAPMLGVFEWFYKSVGADADYLESGPLPVDARLRIATLNATTLLELDCCDQGVVPTRCQHRTFPRHHASRLMIQHEGIDTDIFKRDAERATLPLDLPADRPVVTFAARGLEPYRGFPQFMHGLARFLDRRSDAVAVVVGTDEVHYSAYPPAGSWRKAVLAELPGLDLTRLHFVDRLPAPAFRSLLLRSDCHVYFSVPFVLSWSLLEAMALEVPLLGADTETVAEAIDHGIEGHLVEMRDPDAVAAGLEAVLADPKAARARAKRARERVIRDYDCRESNRQWLWQIENLASAKDVLARTAAGVAYPQGQPYEVASLARAAPLKVQPH